MTEDTFSRQSALAPWIKNFNPSRDLLRNLRPISKAAVNAVGKHNGERFGAAPIN